MIDQTRLPHAFETARLNSMLDAAHAIKAMIVRGAPLIGATAAYGVTLQMRSDASDAALDELTTRSWRRARPPSTCAGRWTAWRAALEPVPHAERFEAARREAASICDEDAAT